MFFTQINQLMAQSVDITMVIRKSATGMTVSVLPKSNGLKDEARNHIVPLTLSGLPGELDAGFMNAIANPIRKVSGLLTNMAEFEKQADKAAANSKASKEQKAKETKEEKEKREKYEKHMKKAEELIAAKNHKEAVTALGQAQLYATEQNRKTVDEKIEEQKRAMNQGSLFDLMEQAEQQPGQQAPPPTRGGTEAYDTTTDRTDASTATPAVCTTASTATCTAADAGTATGVSPAGTTADAAATAVPVYATGSLSPGGTRRTAAALRGANAALLH